MNTRTIGVALTEIIELKNKLKKLDYNDPNYDQAEDALHVLEDKFLKSYGKQLEEILMDVHDEFCPDIDILSPLSYIAEEYISVGQNDRGPLYDVEANQGLHLELDDYPGKPTRFVLMPNPLRVVLNVDASSREVVWSETRSVLS